jgi:tetratricopeptide (TPR) repeat protein
MGYENEDAAERPRDTPALDSGAALGLALAAASRAKADVFLEEQTASVRMQREAGVAEKQARILDLQIQDLEREDVVRHWSLRVRHISDVMKLAFELAVAFIVLAIAFGIGAALWSAAHDDSLVIEAFSVPPDMAARGLTGQAVAAQLQDRLLTMQAATDSGRPAESYSNSWGNDIKVEIPNTGISISEFYRYLATWLGKQTHIRGEVYRSTEGIVIAARAGADGGTKVSGDEHDLDKLLQQSAEAIYRRTQPYRYAVFLANQFKFDAARETYEQLANEGAPLDRVWAQIGLGSLYDYTDPPRGPEHNRKAAELSPGFALPWGNLSYEHGSFGNDEAALAEAKTGLHLLEQGDAELSERAARISLPNARATVDFALNDFGASLRDYQECVQLPDYSGMVEGARDAIPAVLALLHQPTAARVALSEIPPAKGAPGNLFDPGAGVVAYYWLGDWTSTIAMGRRTEAVTNAPNALPGISEAYKHLFLAGQVWPYVARAMAETGDRKAAHALIDRSLPDCYTCMRNRADIDTVEGNWNGASFWFARAVAAAPSIPMAYFDWGRVLMKKGDVDGAIAKFAQAHEKGPHFADPLELWGEALMRKSRSDLALAKFEEANKYAPRWGRLHLKWGEALSYLGRKDEARAQFQAASGMDLSAADRRSLAK